AQHGSVPTPNSPRWRGWSRRHRAARRRYSGWGAGYPPSSFPSSFLSPGLAPPTSFLGGTGRGAELGILIKGPDVLESTRRIDTVVLDKTGTVTTGRMALVDVLLARGEDRTQVLRLAGAVEDASEHPIAQAIASGARAEVRDLPQVEHFTTLQGLGVQGVVLADRTGYEVLVGQARLLEGGGPPPARALGAGHG